jgi:hypothetical protein
MLLTRPGIGTIIFMLILASYFLYSELTMPSLVSREDIIGTVTNVKHGENKSSVNSFPLVELEISINQKIKLIFFGRPSPVVGDQVPLIVEVYNNDEQTYSVNYNSWKELN